MVFQDPYESLNPRRRVGDLIADGVVLGGGSRGDGRARATELLERVGLPATAADGYPHEFSGGQRQRIAIARTLAAGPSCLIADEPISALDASAQAQVANLLTVLVREEGIGLLLVSHDLSVVRQVADRVAVMYLGRIVEVGGTAAVWSSPRHPYTEALVAAIPRADGAGVLPADLPGDVPDPASPPSGCRFHPRCPAARDDCAVIEQHLVTVAGRAGRLPRPRPAARRPRHPRGTGSHVVMWLVNAHVVDVLAGDVLPARAVETAPDGTIAQVTASAPPGLPDKQVTDVAGRWLLPGLISCHTHLSVVFPFSDTDEAENPALTAYRSAARATAALQAGITTIRCVHEQNRADLLLREAAGRGWISAPRILGPAARSPSAAATARGPAARTPAARTSSTRPPWPSSARAPTM